MFGHLLTGPYLLHQYWKPLLEMISQSKGWNKFLLMKARSCSWLQSTVSHTCRISTRFSVCQVYLLALYTSARCHLFYCIMTNQLVCICCDIPPTHLSCSLCDTQRKYLIHTWVKKHNVKLISENKNYFIYLMCVNLHCSLLYFLQTNSILYTTVSIHQNKSSFGYQNYTIQFSWEVYLIDFWLHCPLFSPFRTHISWHRTLEKVCFFIVFGLIDCHA